MPISPNILRAHWNALNGATGYFLQRDTVATFDSPNLITTDVGLPAGLPFYDYFDALEGATYYGRAAGYDGTGTAVYSIPVAFTVSPINDPNAFYPRVQIEALQVINYQGKQIPDNARLFSNKKWTTYYSQVILAGEAEENPKTAYRTVPVTYDATLNIVTVAAFAGNNNVVDANIVLNRNYESAYTLALFKGDKYLETIYTNLRVKDNLPVTTWAAINTENNHCAKSAQIFNYVHYEDMVRELSKLQIARRATALVAGTVKLDTVPDDLNNPVAVGANSLLITGTASPTDYGRTKLSDAPNPGADAVAVGTNSPFYKSGLTKKYLKGFASLSAAITATGNTPTELIANETVFVTTNVTVPPNISIVPESNTLFLVSTGARLTINSFAPKDGNKQYFGGAGEVVLARAAINEINSAWWTGAIADPLRDYTHEFSQVILSLQAQASNKAIVPSGNWRIKNLPNTPNFSIIQGCGASLDAGAGGTVFTVIDSADEDNPNYAFKVGGNSRNIHFRDLCISGAGGSLIGTTGVLLSAVNPNVIIATKFHNVCFHALDTGAHFNSEDANSLQIAQTYFESCDWIGCKTPVRNNTNNAALTLTDCYVNVPPGATAFDMLKSGIITVNQCEFAGISAPTPYWQPNGEPSAAFQNSTIFKLSGEHLSININGCQDEGIANFLVVDVSENVGTINISGGTLIQSLIRLNEACIVNFDGVTFGASNLVRSDETKNIVINAAGYGYIVKPNGLVVAAGVNPVPNTTVGFVPVTQAIVGNSGGLVTLNDDNPHTGISTSAGKAVYKPSLTHYGQPTDALIKLFQNEPDKVLLEILLTDPAFAQVANIGYKFSIQETDKHLNILATQAGNFPGVNLENCSLTVSRDIETGAALRSISAFVEGNISAFSTDVQSLTVGANGTPIVEKVKGIVQIDLPSLPPGVNSVTATLTGAAVGDFVSLNTTALSVGLYVFGARISAANTLFFFAENRTGANIDEPSANWIYILEKG
jgi:hypothetical protein